MSGVIAAEGYRVVTADFRANARTWANMFEARILEPGLVSYRDSGGPISMLPRETIARCVNSFVGKPLIYVTNKNGKGVHKKITPANMEDNAAGYISSVYEGSDGWFWARGVVFNEEAKDAIKRVGFCSCGYHVDAASEGGEHHAIKFDETIQQFSGEHLAIVDRPRYEGATIRLNSKGKTNTHMFKWIKKALAPATSAGGEPAAGTTPAKTDPAPAAGDKTNAAAAPEAIDASTVFHVPGADGKDVEVTLGELIEAHAARTNGLDPEAEVEVDGKPVKVSALVDGYRANAKPAAPAKNEPAKPNHFKVVLTARDNAAASHVPTGGAANTLEQRLERGNDRYSSKKSAAAKA